MEFSRRESLLLTGSIFVAGLAVPAVAEDAATDKVATRIPFDEFAQDADLMKAFRRGVRAMKARKPSDPLSWFFQAAIHGVTLEQIQIAAATDPDLIKVDQKKYWNQCPHFGQPSANFLPWHRAYTYYFERILRAHTGEPRFSLPYWDYSRPENYRFPREFGRRKLDEPLDGDQSNPLYHTERNTYFTDWQHWSDEENYKPYAQFTPEAVDWAPARDSRVFFGATEKEGIGGGIGDEDTLTRGRLESFPHDPIHRLVGGLIPQPDLPNPDDPAHPIPQPPAAGGMAYPPTAGFDPIFSIHHSNIDRLWAEWSCMPNKAWGKFPPKAWFEDAPWNFVDVALKDGVLEPVEVSNPRRSYFDYRALGISFKSEDLSKTPLALPDPIPIPPSVVTPKSLLIASIPAPMNVSGFAPERVAVGEVAAAMQPTISMTSEALEQRRTLIRINGVDLSYVSATGFDVHLVKDHTAKPSRSDPSFLGSIALFRHDGASDIGSTGATGHHAGHRPSDTFDATAALAAANGADPSELLVLVVPFSLSSSTDGQKILEAAALRFDSIEFFVSG